MSFAVSLEDFDEKAKGQVEGDVSFEGQGLDVKTWNAKSRVKGKLAYLDPEFPQLKEMVNIDNRLSLLNGHVQQELNLERDDLELSSNILIQNINIEDVFENEPVLNLELKLDPKLISTDLGGEVKTQLHLEGKGLNPNDWTLKKTFSTDLTYKDLGLPFLEGEMTFKDGLLHLGNKSKGPNLELSNILALDLSKVKNLEEVDFDGVSGNLSLSLIGDDIEKVVSPWAKLLDLELDVRGDANLDVDLTGNINQLHYHLKSELKDLFYEESLPEKSSINMTGQSEPIKVLEWLDKQKFPNLSFKENELKSSLMKLESISIK